MKKNESREKERAKRCNRGVLVSTLASKARDLRFKPIAGLSTSHYSRRKLCIVHNLTSHLSHVNPCIVM